MTNLSGKKLMILGGNRETGFLVEEANLLGIHTIVVDPNPLAPAKKFALEHYELDGFDVPGIVGLARSLGVDGVLVGVADILVKPYQEICQQLELPGYATSATTEAFGGKDGFKEACERFAVADIPGVVVEGKDLAQALSVVQLPAMIKPVDNGGGVGMRICATLNDVDRCAAEAIKNSKRAKFLVERYMDCDDMFAYYTFKDGNAYLSATADRIATKRQRERSPVCLAARYPSRHTAAFVERAHPQLLKMFDGIGVTNGVLCIQFFVENSSFYAYDPGFRLQGEAPHIHLKSINGFDHRQMLINFALTGSMGVDEFEQLNDYHLRGRVAATFWVLLKSGRIQSVDGLDEIRKDHDVTTVLQRLSEGDEVDSDMLGTERQVFARIYAVSGSPEGLAEKARQLRGQLSVVGEDGHDMILDWVTPESLL